ncbi:MAG: DUF4129 domain-containing protein [Burkholderiales bacterium]
MRIENLAVVLRARTPWEASDLGVVMLKQWWRPAIGAWLAVYLPVAAVLALTFPERPSITVAILWWLKPVFDRFVLHVLSHAVFGDLPSVGATLRAWRAILRAGVWADLTYKRISLRRSFHLPIAQLEGTPAKSRTARIRVLGQRVGVHAAAITIACMHFEFIGAMGIEALASFMMPADPNRPDFELRAWLQGWAGRDLIEPLGVLYYVIAVSLIEPLYVAQGFALYLTRRTHLEGWDLELGLRRIANRLGGSAGAIALACLLVAFALPPTQLLAAESPAHDAKAKIVEILNQPTFEVYQDVTEWRWKGEQSEAKAPKPDRWSLAFLETLASLLRSLAWIAAVAVVAAAIWYGRRFVQPPEARAASRRKPAETAFGFDVRPASLPRDLGAAARELIAKQHLREALSMLYRGALSVLIYRYHVEVLPGDTERACVHAAGAALPPDAARFFFLLVRAWEQSAYAGRSPQQEECNHLVGEWVAHFDLVSHAEQPQRATAHLAEST